MQLMFIHVHMCTCNDHYVRDIQKHVHVCSGEAIYS